ncbi:hypothetical protein ACFWBX_32915 [Streptomyces sp. NPDC059991]
MKIEVILDQDDLMFLVDSDHAHAVANGHVLVRPSSAIRPKHDVAV